MAIARGPEMSTRAASAAQASRNDDATTAVPNNSSPSGPDGWMPLSRRATAGIVNTRAIAKGRISLAGTPCLPVAVGRTGGLGDSGQAWSLAEGLVHPHV